MSYDIDHVYIFEGEEPEVKDREGFVIIGSRRTVIEDLGDKRYALTVFTGRSDIDGDGPVCASRCDQITLTEPMLEAILRHIVGIMEDSDGEKSSVHGRRAQAAAQRSEPQVVSEEARQGRGDDHGC